ncbi:VOC family protein [Demequina soli]|uniref:VOC family protein n=1 Tax=Demequina soli TaxID=1638987 RepID=UPI000785DD69|nr:VOC family protein [Demequina soli]
MPAIFVSMPATDLERTKAFYVAVGFTLDSQLTSDTAACAVVEEGHSYLMAVSRDLFQSFTEKPIGDPRVNPVSAVTVYLDSREAVDAAVLAGVAAGGSEDEPATDYGFMYQRQVCDPDGNILQFGFMDASAAPSPA